MQTVQRTPTEISSLPKKAKFVIKLSDALEHKIRTYCTLSPDREWSGVMFYTFEGNFNDGITISANDMYLMDQGSAGHTEFDLNEPEITRYMVLEGLMNQCIGLIHSHNKMAAFFSGEDSGTLNKYGLEMNNFVSLVVNNEGKYVARLTRKVGVTATRKVILKGSTTYKLFNTEKQVNEPFDSTSETKLEDTLVEYVNLEIVKPDFGEEYYEAISRFEAINKKCTKTVERSPFGYGYGAYGGYSRGYNPLYDKDDDADKVFDKPLNSKPKKGKEKEKFTQGSLFDEDTQAFKLEGDVQLLDWESHGYDLWFSRLLHCSPLEASEAIIFKALERQYDASFNDEKEFAAFFDVWFDYMVASFDTKWITVDEWGDPEELLCQKVIEDLEKVDFSYADTICDLIRARLF